MGKYKKELALSKYPKIFYLLKEMPYFKIVLLIMRFNVIHLNLASCKFCNTLPQTLLLETATWYYPFPKEYSRSSHKARQLCHLRNYIGSSRKCEFLSSVAKQMGTCTCLEAWQCAGPWSHGQFSGRQSHASFEGYTRINPFQLQQIHSGGEIQKWA